MTTRALTSPGSAGANSPQSLVAVATERIVDAVMVPFLDALDRVDGAAAIAAFGKIRAMVDGAEATLLARATHDCVDERAAARVAGQLLGNEASRADRRRRFRRGQVAAAKPEVAESLRRGETTSEHLDALAPVLAADPAALEDTNLLDAVLGTNADRAKRIAKNWVDSQITEPEVADRVKREQAQRRAYTYTRAMSGLDVIAIEGDHISMKRLWHQIEAEADRLWRQDGGRDVKPHEHPRNHKQRLFDAAYNLLCGTAKPATGRPAIVVTIPIDKFTGQSEQATIDIGTGPLPDAMLADDADIYAMIADMTGQPLWLGRSRRHATRDQFIALVVRDKGCVMCARDWRRCQAHHLTPWNSPAQGRTDIDTQALNCGGDHRRIHDNKLTQYRKPDGTYATRAALPHEIAPNRPAGKRRKRGPKRAANRNDGEP